MNFNKIQSVGNDFIVVNEVMGLKNDELRELSIKLCNRQYSIGGDGLIVIYVSNYKYHVRFFNCYGMEIRLSGNGLRCVGKLLELDGCVLNNNLTVNTLSGDKYLKFNNEEIEIDFGIPRLIMKYKDLFYKEYSYFSVDVGVIHLVMCVDDVYNIELNELYRKIKNKNHYCLTIFSFTPSSEDINVRSFIKGSNEAISSSLGALAAFYIYRKIYNGNRSINVHLLGGDVMVSEGVYQQVLMKGKAKLVYKGQIEL